MKKILFYILSTTLIFPQIKGSTATAYILSTAVGTRFPTGTFGKEHAMGYGFNTSLYYTHSDIIPVLLFGRFDFEHYAASQDFLKNNSTYSSVTSFLIPVSIGVKNYHPPILTEQILFLPFWEIAFVYAYSSKVYSFRQAGINDKSLYNNNFGFNIAGGLSAILFDFSLYYTYLPNNTHFGLDIRVNIPIYTRF